MGGDAERRTATVVVFVLLWPTFRHNGCIKKGNETTSIWIHFKVNLVILLLIHRKHTSMG